MLVGHTRYAGILSDNPHTRSIQRAQTSCMEMGLPATRIVAQSTFTFSLLSHGKAERYKLLSVS